MINLKIDNILRDSKRVKFRVDDTYLKSYHDFIVFFEDKPIIKENDFVIGAHLVYGWMPTIINFNTENIESNVKYLNKVKNGDLLSEFELESLKKAVNNSIVGVSKLLHFINPQNYAIWDSRIHRYVTGKKSSYGVNNVCNFIKYQSIIRDLSKHASVNQLQSNIEILLGYKVTKIRAIEMTMFEFDKNNNTNY